MKTSVLLQVDCPEDVASYIHRVGRTARYVSSVQPSTFRFRASSLNLRSLQLIVKTFPCNAHI